MADNEETPAAEVSVKLHPYMYVKLLIKHSSNQLLILVIIKYLG